MAFMTDSPDRKAKFENWCENAGVSTEKADADLESSLWPSEMEEVEFLAQIDRVAGWPNPLATLRMMRKLEHANANRRTVIDKLDARIGMVRA